MAKLGKKVTFDVAITSDLQIGFFARGDVDAETGKAALEMLLKALEMEDITLSGVTAIERHDDQRIQQVHDLTHLHNHDHSH